MKSVPEPTPEGANSDLINNFFDRFPPLPADRADCYTNRELIAFAQKGGDPPHVSTCPHCSAVVHLLRKPDTRRGLDDFVKMARAKSMAARPAPVSFWVYLKTFFVHSPRRWATAAALPLVLLLGILGWVSMNRPADDKTHIVSVSFGDDVVGETADLIRDSIPEVNDPDFPEFQKKARHDEIARRIRLINRLGSRGELDYQDFKVADLLLRYNSEVARLAESRTNSAANSWAVSHAASTPATPAVTRVYTAANQAAGKKKPESNPSNPPNETEQAAIIHNALQQFNIVEVKEASTHNGAQTQVVVLDKDPNRTPADQRALEADINSFLQQDGAANSMKIMVKLVSLSAQTGIKDPNDPGVTLENRVKSSPRAAQVFTTVRKE